MKTDIDVPWSTQGSARSTSVVLDVPDGVSAQAPLVVLLHGTSGDSNDMANPAVHPGQNFERILPGTVVDRGWHKYPNAGFWSLGTDNHASVTGWAPFLAEAGFPTLNYSQTGPRDVLVEPVRELRAILDAIDTDGRFAAVRDRSIVLMGHSRGGILARLLLVQLAASGGSMLARIRTCITLHSPNLGSTAALVALELAKVAASWRVLGVPLVPPALAPTALQALDDLVDLIEAEAGAPAYTDFALGSLTLAQLAAAEPVPGVSYFTFGGTRPVLLNLRGWEFTADSVVPFNHAPAFHWRTAYVPFLPLPPPGVLPLPELLEGGGDVLTSALLTLLPFAEHRDNYINHAEALWDDGLKGQVVEILNRTPQPVAIPATSFLAPLLLGDRAHVGTSFLAPILLGT
jgi:pimeloyl-ACP methyl ester carboxylesterase